MQIERHVECRRPLEDRLETRMVQPLPSRPAVQHRSLELQIGHGALELVRGRRRIVGRQRRECGKATGLRTHDIMQPVVDAARHRHGARGLQVLRRRRIVRQNLKRDSSLIHRLETQRSDIVESLANGRGFRCIRAVEALR